VSTTRATRTKATETGVDVSPPVGRRERNKQEKRARIVAAARRLFAEKGFENTTTLEIAEGADIGTGTLFLYARSKEDLLVMVFRDEMIEQSASAFASLDHKAPLPDQLMQVFETMLRYHERDAELAKIMLREIMFPANADRLDDIAELMAVIFEGLTAMLLKAREAGELKADFDPQLVSEGLFSSYFMNMMEWLRGRITSGRALGRLRKHLTFILAALA
jgi:AcrR family transcriptional regulator